MSEAEVRQSFASQVEACLALGSPFTGRVLEACMARLDTSHPVGRRVLGWAGDPTPRGDGLPLRLAGALHALVLSGRAPVLAGLYAAPETAEASGSLGSVIEETLATHAPFTLAFLDRPPQTNEVARSAVLHAGLIALAARTTDRIEVLELGSSAGLNLLLDRYAYDLGGRSAGQPASPLRLRPRWSGPDPQGPEPRIVARRGCDLTPIDIRSAEERLRLRAYVWADQRERLQRLDTAIGIALADPPTVDAMDAAEWVGRRVDLPQADGVARVLMHSIAFQYLPADGQARVRDAMESAGRRATPAAPLAWLSFEQAVDGPELTLRTWPGSDTIRLAAADPHVRSIAWA